MGSICLQPGNIAAISCGRARFYKDEFLIGGFELLIGICGVVRRHPRASPNKNPYPPITNYFVAFSSISNRFVTKSMKMKSRISLAFPCFTAANARPRPPGTTYFLTEAGNGNGIPIAVPTKNFFTNTPSRLGLPAWAGWTF